MKTFRVTLIVILVQFGMSVSLNRKRHVRILKRSLPSSEPSGQADQPVICRPMEYYDSVVDRCNRCDESCRVPFSDTCYFQCADYIRSLIATEQPLANIDLEDAAVIPIVYPTTTSETSAEPVREPAIEQPLVEKPLFWTSVVSLVVAVVATIIIIVLCVKRNNGSYVSTRSWYLRSRHNNERLLHIKKTPQKDGFLNKKSSKGRFYAWFNSPFSKALCNHEQQQQQSGHGSDRVLPICAFIETDTGGASNVYAGASKNTPSLNASFKSKCGPDAPVPTQRISLSMENIRLELMGEVNIRNIGVPVEIHQHVTNVKHLDNTTSAVVQTDVTTVDNMTKTDVSVLCDSKTSQSHDSLSSGAETHPKCRDTDSSTVEMPVFPCQTTAAVSTNDLGIRQKGRVDLVANEQCPAEIDSGLNDQD